MKPYALYGIIYKGNKPVKTYRLNSLGFRDDELNQQANIKVLCLGDSTTYGIGVFATEKIFSFLLEQKLKTFLLKSKNQYSIDVFNAGVPSYSVYQGLQIYKNHILNLAGWDYLIVSFGWNHGLLSSNWEHISNQLKTKKELLKIRTVLKKLKIFNLLSNGFQKSIRDSTTNYDNYKTVYETLIRTAKVQKTKIIIWPLMIQKKHSNDSNSFINNAEKINNISRQIAQRHQSVYIDLNQKLERSPKKITWIDSIHFGSDGHAILAEEFYNVIKKDL